MSINENELEGLATVYRQLVDYPPFKLWVAQMEAKVENLKESIINNLDNDIVSKSIITGIRLAIYEPTSVIAELDDSQTRETI